MNLKSGLAGLSLTLLVAVPNVGHAATTTDEQVEPTTISVSGHTALHTPHIVAKDPWSGVDTTWVPDIYVVRTLREVGIVENWNPSATAFSLVKYPPGHTLKPLGTAKGHDASSNEIQFNLVPTREQPSGDMPMLSAKNPATGEETVYMPIWYVDHLILNAYWDMNAAWNGNKNQWSLDFRPIR